jgi:tetratricopeptide (TPR) repeat protein
MESILNNLQKIEDLRVISRTSVEKFRTQQKTIPEIARELGVSYLVEGSGQKAGDKILLNIQLIDAKSDKHLWAEQYARETDDIFELQQEVAQKIAGEIEVIITPEEEKRISEVPTDNLVAYDYFLQGLDLLKKRQKQYLSKSISYFNKAITHDNEFGRAYAAAAMAYYYLDENQLDKQFSDSINYYADKALFYNPQLPQSLIAKALFYMENEEYTLAIPYFEKALEFNPNYDLVFVFLLDLYANKLPDTEKYLEYALKGLKIDLSAYDSTIASYNYLHISNAFIQSGFVEEAEKYINKSLDYYPKNLFAQYVKAYIHYAGNKDLQQLRSRLIAVLAIDTNRYDIMIEIGKICYFMLDYNCAYNYFEKFRSIRQAFNLDVYQGENAKIAYVLKQKGFENDSENLFKDYLEYAENDETIYKHLSLAAYYSYKNDKQKAIEELEKFADDGSFHYWTIIFLEMDPLMDNIKDLPEFKRINRKIEKKFWDRYERIKKNLETKDLI